MPTNDHPTTTEEGIEHTLRGLETVAGTGGYREKAAVLETAVAMRWLDNFGHEFYRRRVALVEELTAEVKPEDVPEDVPDEHDGRGADGTAPEDVPEDVPDDHPAEETGSVAADLSLNADAGREQIIFGEVHGVTRVTHFDHGPYSTGDPISPDQARRLMAEDYLHPQDQQNDSPTADVLVGAAEAINHNTTEQTTAGLGGYIVPSSRPDARVSITALVVTHDDDAPTEDHDAAADVLDELSESYFVDYVQNLRGDERVLWWD